MWSHGRVFYRGGDRLHDNFRRTLGCMWMEDCWGQEWWPGQGLVCRDLGGLQWTTVVNRDVGGEEELVGTQETE